MDRSTARGFHGLCIVVLLAPLALSSCIPQLTEEYKKERRGYIDQRLPQIDAEQAALLAQVKAGEITDAVYEFKNSQLVIEEARLKKEYETLAPAAPKGAWIRQALIGGIITLVTGGTAGAAFGGRRALMVGMRLLRMTPFGKRVWGSVTALVQSHDDPKSKLHHHHDPIIKDIVAKVNGGGG